MKTITAKRIVCLALLVLTLVVGSRFAAALEPPPLTARVNDYAAILSPATRQQLENVLTDLERKESTQLAVLTITSLEGANLEEFSLKVAETWRLGQKGRDNGALLLIAKNDRKIRIEVGYGLEGLLTDLTAGRIIRDIITPRFRDGNFDLGVSDGVAAMIAAVRGEFTAPDSATTEASGGNDLAGLLVFLLFAFFNLGKIAARHHWLAASIGALLAPVIGLFFQGLQWLPLLLLVPAGFVGGLFAALILGNMRFSSGRRSSGFGGSSSPSSGSGFGGGGGGFGGGGSSGGW
jgi:uncharacterized protein